MVVLFVLRLEAVDLKDAQEQFLTGDYRNCIAAAQKGVQSQPNQEEWPVLLSRALLVTGQYPQALAVITNALDHDRWNLALRWQAREVFLSNGQTDAANEMVEQIMRMLDAQPRAYRDASSMVAFGQAALLKGADPKRVLDNVFNAAMKEDPNLRDTYLARGALALDKHDFKLAAKIYEEGLKKLPEDPDLQFGLAEAYAPSDTALMISALEAALERNSNHLDSLLSLTAHSIDAEDYAQATSLLDRVKSFNAWDPEAWAYRAVIAHLQNQPEQEQKARETALKFWPSNPHVDYLIGLKLSQNYRFAEGAAYQKQALAFDGDYLPAKAQLAQDLLRLGEEADGWKLADEVQKRDPYDIAMFNLTTLHDTMVRFVAVTNGDFLLRMSPHEAALYGQQALALLSRAKTNLTAKYGFELPKVTIVEIFPEQKDFAVRTFGMPGNPGYLGVCFGSVITANSPAAHLGHPVNWQAVLWHEFCHVVTLQLTHNKMPRWLSEGISVYEESQANPSWGQRMNPRYREMVLGNELTPVSKLSAAFLAPRSDLYLQFAYYESSLVVEFLVQQFGQEHLKALLKDLAEGIEINEAIQKNTAPMDRIEADFAAFARARALGLAPGLDWEKPEMGGLSSIGSIDDQTGPGSVNQSKTNETGQFTRRRSNRSSETNNQSFTKSLNLSSDIASQATLDQWISLHPTNYYALTERADALLEQKQFEKAKAPLSKLIDLYPTEKGPNCPYAMLAAAHRALGETNAERQVLASWSAQDDEAKEAYLRLMELSVGVNDWSAVIENANRFLAVDPLSAPPYRYLAQASEQVSDTQTAIGAYRAMLQLDPPDPAEVHYRLARALHRIGDPEAKRQVLEALEEAPRYRAALGLLLELSQKSSTATTNASAVTAEANP
jgi:cytochrome c-type biogenesis protein CcmH/NrfG